MGTTVATALRSGTRSDASLMPVSASHALKRSQAPGSAGATSTFFSTGLTPPLEAPALGAELGEEIDGSLRRLQLGLRLDEVVELRDAQPDDLEASGEGQRARERIGRDEEAQVAAAADDALGADRRGPLPRERLARREVLGGQVEPVHPELGMPWLPVVAKQKLAAQDLDAVDLERRHVLQLRRDVRRLGRCLGLGRPARRLRDHRDLGLDDARARHELAGGRDRRQSTPTCTVSAKNSGAFQSPPGCWMSLSRVIVYPGPKSVTWTRSKSPRMPSICESERRVKCVAIGSRTSRTITASATTTSAATATRRAHRGHSAYASLMSSKILSTPRANPELRARRVVDDYIRARRLTT